MSQSSRQPGISSLDNSSAISGSSNLNNQGFTDRHKKALRILTVIAYMISVSAVALVLSVYYVFLWEPHPGSDIIKSTAARTHYPSVHSLKYDQPRTSPVLVAHGDHQALKISTLLIPEGTSKTFTTTNQNHNYSPVDKLASTKRIPQFIQRMMNSTVTMSTPKLSTEQKGEQMNAKNGVYSSGSSSTSMESNLVSITQSSPVSVVRSGT